MSVCTGKSREVDDHVRTLGGAEQQGVQVRTLPALNTVGSFTQVVYWAGMTVGAGRKPPSVPIWTQLGPCAAGDQGWGR